MGTRHDASSTGTGMGRGARADEGTPRSTRSRRTILTVGLGGLATLWSVLATLVASTSARVTYYLPPPDGSTEAVERHDWIESVLALIPVSLVAGLLALVATALAVAALVRRRTASPWLLVLACLALVIAFLVSLAVPWLASQVGVY